MESQWWQNAYIYELYIDKFASDIRGLTERLDYFERLGISALHILPHYPSPMLDDGYDVSDYRAVRKDLGTLDDFKALLAGAHARGIRIIVDFVANHVSTEHPWFLKAKISRTNPERDYFLWSDSGSEFAEAPNPFPDIKNSNWTRNEATGDFYYSSFYPEQADLNWDNPAVFQAMFDNLKFWVDLGVDGFRLDAVGFLIKRDKTRCLDLPETHAILKKIRAHVDSVSGGTVVLLGEVHQSIKETQKYFGNGDECHLLYNFPLMEQMLLALVNGNSGGVDVMMRASADIPSNCQWATFLRNHDEISLTTLVDSDRRGLVDHMDPTHRYPFNRGTTTSLRLGSAFAHEPDRLRAAFELLYSLPGVPVLYYGEEIGMRNLPLIPGVVDTRKYVRGPFDWSAAEKQIADPGSLFNHVASLIHAAKSRKGT